MKNGYLSLSAFLVLGAAMAIAPEASSQTALPGDAQTVSPKSQAARSVIAPGDLAAAIDCPKGTWTLAYRAGVSAVQPVVSNTVPFGSDYRRSTDGFAQALTLEHRFPNRFQVQLGVELGLNFRDNIEVTYLLTAAPIIVPTRTQVFFAEMRLGYDLIRSAKTELSVMAGAGTFERWSDYEDAPLYVTGAEQRPSLGSSGSSYSGFGYTVGLQFGRVICPRWRVLAGGNLREYGPDKEASLSAMAGVGYTW